MSTEQSPNNSKTRMLLPLDGPVGGNTIIDTSIGGTVPKIFSVGKAVFSADQAKFGDTSLRCYGLDNSLKCIASPEWNFGRSTWYIAASFYALAEPCTFCFYKDDDNYMGLQLVKWGGQFAGHAGFKIRYIRDGRVIAETGEVLTGSLHIMNAWAHFVLQGRVDTATGLMCLESFVDGNFSLKLTIPTDTNRLDFGSWPLYFGRCPIAGRVGLGGLDGFIDEVLVHGDFLLDDGPGGPLAGAGGYSLPTQVTHNRRKITGIGAHNVYEPGFKIRGEGTHLVGGKQISMTGAGQSHVYERFKISNGGQHNVYAGEFKVTGSGEHNVGSVSAVQLRRFKVTGGGQHNVYDSFKVTENGQHTLLSLAIKITGSGQHDVLKRVKMRGEGTHSVRHAILLREAGVHDVKKTATTYQLYYAFAGEPDLESAPWETFASLPHETAAITGEGKHYFPPQ